MNICWLCFGKLQNKIFIAAVLLLLLLFLRGSCVDIGFDVGVGVDVEGCSWGPGHR